VGDVWSHPELLEVIADPKHPDHSQMKEWVGGEFDPKRFCVDEMNGELGKRH
jgi:hypothetical protein